MDENLTNESSGTETDDTSMDAQNYQFDPTIRNYSESMNQVLRDVRRWQSSNYMKLWRTEWPDLVPRNFQLIINILQAHAIEFDLITNLRHFYPHITNEMDMSLKGTNLTPDFVWEDVTGNITVLEYKVTFDQMSYLQQSQIEEREERLRKSIAEKYSGENIKVVSRILPVVPEKLSMFKQFAPILRKMRSLYDYVKRLVPTSKMEKLGKYGQRPTNQLFTEISKILVARLSKNYPSLSNHFESLERYRDDCINFLPEAEEFMNYNYFETCEMGSAIPGISSSDQTIFPEHPWDRDLNRLRFEESTGRKMGKVAYRANFVLPAPFMFEIERLSEDDLSMLSGLGLAYWSEISEVESLHEQTLLEQQELDKLMMLSSIIKGESSNESLSTIAEELGFGPELIANRGNLLKEIKFKVVELLAKVESKTDTSGVKLSKHGKLLFHSTSEILKKAHVKYNKVKQKVSEDFEEEADEENIDGLTGNLGFCESFRIIEEDLDLIEKSLIWHKINIEIPDFKDAYVWSNHNLNDWSNNCVDEGLTILEPVLNCMNASIVYKYQKWKGTLVASLSRIKTKTYSNFETSLVRDHYTGITTIATPAVSETLSGALIVYGKIKYIPGMEKLNLTWIGPLIWHKTTDYWYFISRPFRINWEEALSCDMHLYGSIGLAVAANGFNFNLYKSNLYWSLFFGFSRQLKFALDIVYLFMKSSFTNGTFGKEDLKGKFDIIPRDVRLSTIIYRLKANHKEFSIKAFKSTATSTEGQLKGIDDPIFYGCTHTGWNSLLLIAYLKQSLTKDDGPDKMKYLGDFFRADMEYQHWWNISKCNRTLYPTDGKLDAYDFFMGYILKDDKKHWEKCAFHPGVCYRISEKMYLSAVVDKTEDAFRKEWNAPAVNSGVNSSVCLSDKLSEFYNVPTEYAKNMFAGRYEEHMTNIDKSKKSKKKQQYEGLISMKLVTALLLEDRFLKICIKQGLDYQNGLDGTVWPFLHDFKIPKSFTVDDKQLTLGEMASIQTMIYAMCAVIIELLKNERNYAKRPFYQQMLDGRNINKMLDTLAQSALKSKSNISDLIMIPGMKKNITITKRMTDLNTNLGDMAVSEDMTKFMDTYSNQSIMLMVLAARDVGIISDAESVILQYAVEKMGNRGVLMPSKYRDKLQEIEQNLNKKNVSDKYLMNMKYLTEIKEGFIPGMLNNNKVKDELNKTTLTSAISNNPMAVHDEGMVLGTFNKSTSVYSGGHVIMTKMVSDELFIGDVFTGNTHSDDVDYHTRFPNVDIEVFSNNYMKDLWKLRTKEIEEEELGSYYFENQRVYIKFKHYVERTSFTVENLEMYNKSLLAKRFEPNTHADGMRLFAIRKVKMNGKFMTGAKKIQIRFPDGTTLKTNYPNKYISKIFLTMILFFPRLVSQRPSLLKVNTGSASEMLQQVHASNLNIYIPLARYFSTILANLQGKSVASDLNSAVGRAYDMVVNRCPVNIVSAMLILINIGVGERFGVPAKKRSIMKPLENWGLYWTIPDKLLSFGFSANFARLIANSSSPLNEDTAMVRRIKIMMNTEKIWRTKKRQKTIDEMVQDVEITEPDDIDMNYSAPETLKDFVITFNRYKRTTIEFEKLLSACKDKLLEAVGDKGISDPRDAFELLKTQMGPLVSVNSRSYVHKLVSTLSKMKTKNYSEASVRNSPDIIMVGRFGYYKRMFSNPFSDAVNNYLTLHGFEIKGLMNIEEILNYVEFMANDLNFNIHNLHEDTYRQLCRQYAQPVSQILNYVLDGKVVPRKRNGYEDDKTRYLLISPPKFMTFDTRMLVFSCALIIDRWRNPSKPEENRWVYLIEPYLLGDSKFNIHVTEVDYLCSQLRITQPDELEKHSRLIVSMFAPLAFHGTVNLPLGLKGKNEYFLKSYTFDKIIEYTYIDDDSEKLQIEVPRLFLKYDTNLLERPLLLNLWNLYFFKRKKVKDIELFNKGRKLDFNINKLIDITMEQFVWDAEWAWKMYTLILTEILINKTESKMLMDVNQNRGIAYFKYSNWPGVMVVSESPYSSNPEWTVFIERNSHVKVLLGNIAKYTPALACLVSNICFSAVSGINSTRKLKSLNRKRIPNFVVYDNDKELWYKETISPNNFNVMDIIVCKNLKEMISEFQKLFGKVYLGECSFESVGFKYKEHLVTPWKISKTFSKLTAITTADNDKKFSILDDKINTTNPPRSTVFVHNFSTPDKYFWREFSVTQYMKLWNVDALSMFMNNMYNTDKLNDKQTTALQIDLIKIERIYCISFDVINDYLFGKYTDVIPEDLFQIAPQTPTNSEANQQGKIAVIYGNNKFVLELISRMPDNNQLSRMRIKSIMWMCNIFNDIRKYILRTSNNVPDWASNEILLIKNPDAVEADLLTPQQALRMGIRISIGSHKGMLCIFLQKGIKRQQLEFFINKLIGVSMIDLNLELRTLGNAGKHKMQDKLNIAISQYYSMIEKYVGRSTLQILDYMLKEQDFEDVNAMTFELCMINFTKNQYKNINTEIILALLDTHPVLHQYKTMILSCEHIVMYSEFSDVCQPPLKSGIFSHLVLRSIWQWMEFFNVSHKQTVKDLMDLMETNI